jgi:hypothetical protein
MDGRSAGDPMQGFWPQSKLGQGTCRTACLDSDCAVDITEHFLHRTVKKF